MTVERVIVASAFQVAWFISPASIVAYLFVEMQAGYASLHASVQPKPLSPPCVPGRELQRRALPDCQVATSQLAASSVVRSHAHARLDARDAGRNAHAAGLSLRRTRWDHRHVLVTLYLPSLRRPSLPRSTTKIVPALAAMLMGRSPYTILPVTMLGFFSTAYGVVTNALMPPPCSHLVSSGS